jgi:hypothetical protein
MHLPSLLRAALVLAASVLTTSVPAQGTSPAPAPGQAATAAASAAPAVAVEDLSPAEAVALFKTLPCPTMEEMNGEFSGKMLSFPTFFSGLYWNIASNNPIYLGIWRGKSFRQTGINEGRGYNTAWRLFAGAVDMFPMQTRIGPSYFDGKPSFQLIYRAFDSYAGDIHMLDEVRRLPDGRWLGIGRTGSTTEERRLPMPFLLKARIGTYRQDTGTIRPGFDMAQELQLMEFPADAAQHAAR